MRERGDLPASLVGKAVLGREALNSGELGASESCDLASDTARCKIGDDAVPDTCNGIVNRVQREVFHYAEEHGGPSHDDVSTPRADAGEFLALRGVADGDLAEELTHLPASGAQ